jgi:hypothetical protein
MERQGLNARNGTLSNIKAHLEWFLVSETGGNQKAFYNLLRLWIEAQSRNERQPRTRYGIAVMLKCGSHMHASILRSAASTSVVLKLKQLRTSVSYLILAFLRHDMVRPSGKRGKIICNTVAPRAIAWAFKLNQNSLYIFTDFVRVEKSPLRSATSRDAV